MLKMSRMLAAVALAGLTLVACGSPNLPKSIPPIIDLSPQQVSADVNSTTEVCQLMISAVQSRSGYIEAWRREEVSDLELSKLNIWFADLADKLAARVDGELAASLQRVSAGYRNMTLALNNLNNWSSESLYQVIDEMQVTTQEFNDLCKITGEIETSKVVAKDECLGSDLLIDSAVLEEIYWSAWCSSSAIEEFQRAGLMLSDGETWRSMAETFGVNMCNEIGSNVESGMSAYDAQLAVENRFRDALLDGSTDMDRLIASARAALKSAKLAVEYLCPEIGELAQLEGQFAQDVQLIRALAEESERLFSGASDSAEDFVLFWHWKVENLFPPTRTYYSDAVIEDCLQREITGFDLFTVSYFIINPADARLTPDWTFDKGQKSRLQTFKPSEIGRTYEMDVTQILVGAKPSKNQVTTHFTVINDVAYLFWNLDFCLE